MKITDTLAAVGGGVLSAFVAAPVNKVIVTQQSRHINPLMAIQYIWQKNPILLWTGLFPTVIRNGIYSGATFQG